MVKVLELAEYKNYYELKVVNILHSPFQTYSWANFHEKYFKDKFYFLYIEQKKFLLTGLVLFEASTPYGKLYYTCGRFGVLGFIFNKLSNVKTHDIYTIVCEMVDNIQNKSGLDVISLSLSNLQIDYYCESEIEIFKLFCNDNKGRYFSRVNHVVDISLITDEYGKIDFRDYKRRSNLSRNLKNAKSEGLLISDKINIDILKKWHTIHLERVAQLSGKYWELEFFVRALEMKMKNFIKFFGIYKDGEIVGGAFCFYNRHVLDIFMMSTLREYQQLGANHLLAEHIYTWCVKNEIKYINWQGSNPPRGGIVKFKEQWMAKKHIMHSVNMVCDKEKFKKLNKEYLMKNYPDRFFYPFD